MRALKIWIGDWLNEILTLLETGLKLILKTLVEPKRGGKKVGRACVCVGVQIHRWHEDGDVGEGQMKRGQKRKDLQSGVKDFHV